MNSWRCGSDAGQWCGSAVHEGKAWARKGMFNAAEHVVVSSLGVRHVLDWPRRQLAIGSGASEAGFLFTVCCVLAC